MHRSMSDIHIKLIVLQCNHQQTFNKNFLQARALAELITSGIQPIQNLTVLQKVSDTPEGRSEWGNFWITKGFTGICSFGNHLNFLPYSHKL